MTESKISVGVELPIASFAQDHSGCPIEVSITGYERWGDGLYYPVQRHKCTRHNVQSAQYVNGGVPGVPQEKVHVDHPIRFAF